jgi:NAD(P)H dehydrogenase (quinone)
MTIIAVTGATGKLGGRIARRLERAGVRQRLIVRSLPRAPQLTRSHAVVADYDDLPASVAALHGAHTLLMMSAAETPQRVAQHATFVNAATAAGVNHIVYVSFFGASPTATFTLARDHYYTEQHIRDSGMAYTFLRNNVYADLMPYLVGTDGVLSGPAGRGKVTPVAQDDIADAASLILQRPDGHAGATYDLTGPQALTFDDVAETLTRTTGRKVIYQPQTVAEAYASRSAYSDSQWQLDAWVSTYTAIAAAELDGVSHNVEDLTGHPATTLEDFLLSS